MASSYKIVSINVRGLHDHNKRRKLYAWLNQNKVDIAFLQETFVTKNIENIVNSSYDGKMIHNVTNSPHSRGVSILFSKKIKNDIKIIDIHRDHEARKLIVNIELNDLNYSLINVYAPSGRNLENSRIDFFKRLNKWINQFSCNPENIILAGDMNCPLLNIDRTSNIVDKSSVHLNNIIKTNLLYDCWNISNDNSGSRFTYLDGFNNTKSRLDYIFTSQRSPLIINSIRTFTLTFTDHKAVAITTKLNANKRGPGYWKMSSKHLNDSKYKEMIEKVINDTNNETAIIESHRLKWEILKIKIKEHSIKFSVTQAKQNKNVLNTKQNRLEEIDKLLENTSLRNHNELQEEKSLLKDEIDKFYSDKAEGIKVRAKINWTEHGEKSTKYFFNLEKQRQANNVIRQIKASEEDRILNSDSDILNEAIDFYTKLYTSESDDTNDTDNYLKSLTIPKLCENSKQFCDETITEREATLAVKKLKTNKSPGLDGIISEFYQAFWPTLKVPFLNMLKETYTQGELPVSARKAVLSLLYKKGDKNDLKNYRPISLMNCDYKILAAILATRMQKVIKEIVSKSQTGYIKGRYIGTNARNIIDIYEYIENESLEGIVICLDFAKAFDTVEWSFMHKTLEQFNFGNYFRNWIKILYNNPILTIKNNGWISKPAFPKRGVRQGCPLSALLFVLVVEILALNIKQSDQVKRIDIMGEHLDPISQFADDSTLILADPESVANSVKIIENFSKVAGPKLNKDKCEGIWLGTLKNMPDTYAGIKFSNEPIKCLGIFFGHDKHGCYEKNWTDKVTKIQKLLNRWKQRNLTLQGKILILKSLGLSKLTYGFTILHTPNAILHEVNKLFYSFLWNNHDRIKRNTMIGPIEKGGLEMIDVFCYDEALKCSWIKRLLDTNHNTNIADILIQEKFNLSKEQFLKLNFNKVEAFPQVKAFPTFWQTVFLSFNKCRQNKDLNKMNKDEIFSQIVWGNKLFVHDNKCLLYKNWIKSGYIYVKDFFAADGSFINEHTVFQQLNNTVNWIQEYTILRKILKQSIKHHNPQHCKYTNIKQNATLMFKDIEYKVCDQQTSFYYNILTEIKFIRPIAEKSWSRTFGYVTEDKWSKIYTLKIKETVGPKLSEFNYKLLNALLPCGQLVSKWDKNISKFCNWCREIENTEHMIFSCERVNHIWKKVGEIIHLNITWKNLVIGFSELDEFAKTRMQLFSIIAYSIYKQWVISNNTDRNYRHINLDIEVHNEIKFYIMITSKLAKFAKVNELLQIISNKWLDII